MSIFEFDDQQGVRTRGTLRALGATPGDVLTVGTSRGTVTPSPGGSQPTEGQYSSNTPTTLAAGASGTLALDSFDAGADLLDLTDPAAAAFRTPGTYVVTMNWFASAPPDPGGLLIVNFDIDDADTVTLSKAAGTPVAAQQGSLTVPVVVPVTGHLLITANNVNGGLASIDFQVESVYVVKLA